jgi:DNA helicase HerA-like ATPase
MTRDGAEGVLERDGSFRFRLPAENLDVLPGDYVQVISAGAGAEQFLGQVEQTAVEFVLETDTTVSTQTLPSVGDRGPDTISTRRSRMIPRGLRDGAGRVLARLHDGDDGLAAVLDFDVEGHTGDIYLSEAPGEAVESFMRETYADKGPTLRVGALLGVAKPVVARLIPDGFKRPTGLFGQSGSGKSYALGIIVEELILRTNASVVVLDPNGDFVGVKDDLREPDEINDGTNRCTVDDVELDALRSVHADKRERIALFSADTSIAGARRKFLRLSDLDQREVAAALGVDRVLHPEEYHFLDSARNALAGLGGDEGPSYGVESLDKWIRSEGGRSPVEATKRTAERLGRALRNADFASLRIWGSDLSDPTTLVSVLADGALQAVVVDLSTLGRLEKAVVTSVVFRTLFEIQQKRRHKQDGKCTVLLVDEAHHVFPQKALFPEQQLTVDWGSRIAGEGRKYGLYLIVASQLPSKVHEHVLTQCGNLVLMKMASQSDIDALRDSFSFVTASLLERSKWFEKGEALIIGGIVPVPACLLHFEGRKTQEGGRDLEVDWGEVSERTDS